MSTLIYQIPVWINSILTMKVMSLVLLTQNLVSLLLISKIGTFNYFGAIQKLKFVNCFPL